MKMRERVTATATTNGSIGRGKSEPATPAGKARRIYLANFLKPPRAGGARGECAGRQIEGGFPMAQ